MRTKVVVIVLIILMITLSINSAYAQSSYENVKAKVLENKGINEIQQENGEIKKEQVVQVRILEGEYEHDEHEMSYTLLDNTSGIISNVELKQNDKILVAIEEENGEILKVNYKETINQNYSLYIILAFLIILALLIARKNAIKPLIGFIFTVLAVLGGFALAAWQNWNMILTSSIVSIIITVFIAIKVNGINKKTGVMISCSLVGTAIAGIIVYLLFDIIGITNINIKVLYTFINFKDLIVACTILFGGVLANIIVLSSLNIFNFLNKPYKTKSDNIIQGQRSLKL